MADVISIFRNGVRMTLVTVWDNLSNFEVTFRAGGQSAVEEMSIRFLGEDFDTYAERVRSELKEAAVIELANELEDYMSGEVRAGNAELVIDSQGTKRYKLKES